MAVSRADLEELIRELPDSELTAAYEALERLTQGGREVAREQRQQKLRKAGLLEHAATGMTAEAFDSFEPITVRGEPLSDTVIEGRR